MSPLLIKKSIVNQIITTVGADRFMDESIRELHETLRMFDSENTNITPRNGFVYPAPHIGVFEWMPAMHSDECVLVKMVAYNPSNPTLQSLPTILSTMALFDVKTGSLMAIADGLILTAIRTGASSAVASRILAKPDSCVLGLVGCGAQAITQFHALSRIFPLNLVLAYDTDPQTARDFVSKTSFIPVAVQSVSLERIETESDIICTATTVAPGAGPVVTGKNLKRWTHINAVGSDLPGKTELPLALLEKSLVCPDFPEQAVIEGECQQLSVKQIGPSLAKLVKSPAKYRAHQDSPTVFDSTGFALEDLVAMRIILRHAKELGLGEALETETSMPDPKNPYSCLAPTAFSLCKEDQQ